MFWGKCFREIGVERFSLFWNALERNDFRSPRWWKTLATKVHSGVAHSNSSNHWLLKQPIRCALQTSIHRIFPAPRTGSYNSLSPSLSVRNNVYVNWPYFRAGATFSYFSVYFSFLFSYSYFPLVSFSALNKFSRFFSLCYPITCLLSFSVSLCFFCIFFFPRIIFKSYYLDRKRPRSSAWVLFSSVHQVVCLKKKIAQATCMQKHIRDSCCNKFDW